MSNKRGRPKGSTNTAAEIFVEPSRCPTCGSSRRTKYENPFRRDYVGLAYIAIIYRTCRCLDCGQARRDKEKVYAPSDNAMQVNDGQANQPDLLQGEARAQTT
jgi:predicted Zn-ribbon and HTH transcriptional regulator